MVEKETISASLTKIYFPAILRQTPLTTMRAIWTSILAIKIMYWSASTHQTIDAMNVYVTHAVKMRLFLAHGQNLVLGISFKAILYEM